MKLNENKMTNKNKQTNKQTNKQKVTETKNLLMVSATSTLLEIIVSSSIKTILFLDCDLSEKNGFTVFQNFSLSVTSENV